MENFKTRITFNSLLPVQYGLITQGEDISRCTQMSELRLTFLVTMSYHMIRATHYRDCRGYDVLGVKITVLNICSNSLRKSPSFFREVVALNVISL